MKSNLSTVEHCMIVPALSSCLVIGLYSHILCQVTLEFSSVIKCFSPTLDSGLGHMTCFDQWYFDRLDISRSLNWACTLGLLLLCFFFLHEIKHSLTSLLVLENGRDTWSRAKPPQPKPAYKQLAPSWATKLKSYINAYCCMQWNMVIVIQHYCSHC